MAARLRQGMRRHCRPSPASSGAFTDGKFPLDSSQTGGSRSVEKEARVALLGLGYAGFGSDALEDWRQFGTGLVGLEAVERGNSLLAFRMDDRKQRIVIDRSVPEGTRFFGWEVANAVALDALAARLENAGVQVVSEPQALADARRVACLISFHDPGGNCLGAFDGAGMDGAPFRAGRALSGLRNCP